MSGINTLIHLNLVNEQAVQRAVEATRQSARTIEVGSEWTVTTHEVDGDLWSYRVFVGGCLYSWATRRYQTRAAARRAGNIDMRFCAALREAVQRMP